MLKHLVKRVYALIPGQCKYRAGNMVSVNIVLTSMFSVNIALATWSVSINIALASMHGQYKCSNSLTLLQQVMKVSFLQGFH